MRKNGFTLVELLVVIVLLGIVVAVFVPNAISLLSDSGTKVYGVKENIMEDAAEDYIMLNEDYEMPDEVTPTKYITINTLVSNNLMSAVLDNTSGSECIGFVKITVNTTYGYDYEACLLCDNYTTNKTFCTSATYNNI